MASYNNTPSYLNQRNVPFIAFAVILFFLYFWAYSPSTLFSVTPLPCPSYPRPNPSPLVITPLADRTPIRVFLTGGAGYIGSHMSIELLQGDVCYDIIAVDDLSRGDMRNVRSVEKYAESRKTSGSCHSYKFMKADIADYQTVLGTFQSQRTELVIHFAGFAYASESVVEPLKYYENTPFGTENLLKAMKAAGVRRLVYSSSSAVYGSVETPGCSLVEGGPLKPLSPYGQSKLMSEQIIKAFAHSEHIAGRKFSYALLRYFNVIGADEQLRVGPLPKQEFAHYGRIVDSVFNSLIQTEKLKGAGKELTDAEREKISLKIYGNDYSETSDGTAMRDYIHVTDLVDAHRLISYGVHDNNELIYNIGYGKGYTVKQVVDTIQKVTGNEVLVDYKEKRPGDPAVVLGDPSLLMGDFHWQPRYNNLYKAIQTHWNWRKKVESGKVN